MKFALLFAGLVLALDFIADGRDELIDNACYEHATKVAEGLTNPQQFTEAYEECLDMR